MNFRATLICLALAGCGYSNELGPYSNIPFSFGQTDEADFVPRFVSLLQSEADALQIGFIDQDNNGTLLLERQDDDIAYWLSPDGAHVILQHGVLHGTRGFGEGLLASELSEPLALIRGLQSGWSDRFHTYLDGNDIAVSRTFRCRIDNRGAVEVDLITRKANTILMRENCKSLDQEFTNLYWVDPTSRAIVLSRQWMGPETGNISTRVVLR